MRKRRGRESAEQVLPPQPPQPASAEPVQPPQPPQPASAEPVQPPQPASAEAPAGRKRRRGRRSRRRDADTGDLGLGSAVAPANFNPVVEFPNPLLCPLQSRRKLVEYSSSSSSSK
ncbi:hypothetical protein ONE63_002216 [Megalurothrips usitatus]|uniref:Uncharacterized protein n=1 Tax=Megalurothrips usitatus TaxID=439358 RepID=A0AAV7XBI0_9NEOP|nr:hypothetical protein ONE63_002216 [Megalurothrips usitatus]